jgi:hypothetical protein
MGKTRIDYHGGASKEVSTKVWYLEDIPDTTFYRQLEERVRPLVYVLRQHGINTESSCHHRGYIQVDGSAFSNNVHFSRELYFAMYEVNCLPYNVRCERYVDETGHFHEICRIQSELLKI